MNVEFVGLLNFTDFFFGILVRYFSYNFTYFLVKFLLPFRQWGARILPCLARPVPFCFHGFLPPPLTSLLRFTQAVPYINNDILSNYLLKKHMQNTTNYDLTRYMDSVDFLFTVHRKPINGISIKFYKNTCF